MSGEDFFYVAAVCLAVGFGVGASLPELRRSLRFWRKVTRWHR